MVKTDKTERMELRLTKDQKNLFQEGAMASGLTITSYVIFNMTNIAKKDVERKNRLVLSDRDRELFLSLLRNPPKPNKKMVELMSGRYAESKGIRWSSDSSI